MVFLPHCVDCVYKGRDCASFNLSLGVLPQCSLVKNLPAI